LNSEYALAQLADRVALACEQSVYLPDMRTYGLRHLLSFDSPLMIHP